METGTIDKGSILLYEPENGEESIVVHLVDETVWLSQAQMVDLFERNKKNDFCNVFREDELDAQAVVRIFCTTAKDGKEYATNFYNLDVIISVGYRVK